MGAVLDPLLGELRTTDSALFVSKTGDTMTGQLTLDYSNPLIHLVESGSGNTFDFQQYSYGTYLRANNTGMTIETANFSDVTFNVSGGTGNGKFNILGPVQVSAAVGTAIRTVTANASFGNLDSTIVGNATTGITITLQDAGVQAGRMFTIKNINTGIVTVATTSSQTIDAATTYSLSAQWSFVTVQSTGSNWIIIAKG